MSATVDREQLEARLRLVEEHIAAENGFDIESTMATYGRNPAIVFNGVTLYGHESIRALYRGDRVRRARWILQRQSGV
jgi:hypothetical protein